MVIHSAYPDPYNAIDPDLCFDEAGDPYLAFGSFWNDIFIVKLDPSTMKPVGQPTNIAFRASNPATGTLTANAHAAEGAGINYNDGFFYLFMSWDQCCQGPGSTYKIVYARARSITGPYYDRNGRASLGSSGVEGATILDQTDGRWVGPGGQFVYQDTTGGWLMVHHAYDANLGGAATLRIKDLYFHDGWPTYTPYPTVRIRAPVQGASVRAGAAVDVTADALESVDGSTNGTLRQVAFYQGSTLLGTVTSPPFALSWTPLLVGTCSLTAVATDTRGNSTTSAAVVLTVVEDPTGLHRHAIPGRQPLPTPNAAGFPRRRDLPSRLP